MLGIPPDKASAESNLPNIDLESSNGRDNNKNSEYDSSKHHEREGSIGITSDSSDKGNTSPQKPGTLTRYISDDFGMSFDDQFSYPNARLIRRMRRCEMRLIPLVNQWVVVDVVITSHELILFDSVENEDGLRLMPTDFSAFNNNGGRNARLCDIARDRKVLDKFNLEDVDFVDIEHRKPSTEGNDVTDQEDIEAINSNNLLEYWEGGNCSIDDHQSDAMDKRWSRVDEDRLKIHFNANQMTLFLRFFVGLKEMEEKKSSHSFADDPNLMNHVGAQTKLWCRTIARCECLSLILGVYLYEMTKSEPHTFRFANFDRLRGANNLRQNLPHFGDDGDGELEDFIEVCDRNDDVDNRRPTRRTMLRRGKSFADLTANDDLNNSRHRRIMHNRGKSFADLTALVRDFG